MWLNTLLLALRSIRRNLMRSFLTILGIVIGVSAVITMVTVGNGATLSVQNQISGLGTNLLQIRPGQRMGPGSGSSSAPLFKEGDAEAIATQIGGVAAAAPQSRTGGTLVANGRNWASIITGSTNEWLMIGNWTLAQGREFSDAELRAGASVCMIGETVRRELFGSSPSLGESLRVKQISCEVIGVLGAKGPGSFGNDQDDLVLVPIKTLQRRITGNTQVNDLLVSMADDSDSTRVKASLTQLLRERRNLADTDEDNFNVLDTKQLADTLSGTTKVMTTLLGAVAAVSLLVGGIGIMNIMLVSVTERTREIGIRLAIGALEREVLLQFLIEAVMLSSLGGLIGIALATGASIALSNLMSIPYLFDASINLLSFLFSAAIGVIFGYFPARRAAGLNPIDALRHE
ncbi:MAG: ABC transporter permease [Gammaproteobacteria bacterium]|nr:ABC transporter permease [Gammaproteobacteria bacterium]MBU1730886.1 ABC transporter permease [Gammaproteobacteria bacterium]MBU1893546.1 ABC transporter permease [Gammaproteobacteria bacterium]